MFIQTNEEGRIVGVMEPYFINELGEKVSQDTTGFFEFELPDGFDVSDIHNYILKDGELVYSESEESKAMKAENEARKKREENLDTLVSLLKTSTEQSDKLGYLWNCTYVGDVCVSKEYVEDPDAKGTYDKPIEWAPGIPLIQNAYYIHDSKKYVYVGEPSSAGDIWDASDFEEVDW